MTPLDFTLFFATTILLVIAVGFLCGWLWARDGHRADDDAAADAIASWAHGLREDAPAAPTLALVRAPLALPAPLATVPPRGPERHYSALEAWRLEHDTRRDADTSVTKLEAYVVAGMVCRDQIDARAAGILTQMRHALAGDLAA
jgi:hypothetical protein